MNRIDSLNHLSLQESVCSQLFSLGNQPLSLYFHVPFCEAKCDYCSFYSQPYQKASADFWLEEMEQKIPFFLNQLKPASIATIYFGGGTPSLLPAFYYETLFNRLISTCKKLGIRFSPQEVSIEANPASLSCEWIKALHSLGVNRLTVGVQTFDQSIKKWMGRCEKKGGGFFELQEKLLFAHSLGIKKGIDLICGYPQQTWDLLLFDLETALSLPIEHISLYRLILEDSPLAKRIGAFDEKILSEGDINQLKGEQFLNSNGFLQYEISNFALKGCQSLHNQIYWEMKSSLGLGPSAVSTLNYFESGRLKKAIRLSVDPHYQIAVEPIELPEILFERIMMGIRMNRGVDLAAFKNDFAATPTEVFPMSCKKWQEEGLLVCSEKEFRLSAEGRNFSNLFLIDLLKEREEQEKSVQRADNLL